MRHSFTYRMVRAAKAGLGLARVTANIIARIIARIIVGICSVFLNKIRFMSLSVQNENGNISMKRQRYSLAVMTGAIFIAFGPHKAMATSCVAPPEKLQLHFAFD